MEFYTLFIPLIVILSLPPHMDPSPLPMFDLKEHTLPPLGPSQTQKNQGEGLRQLSSTDSDNLVVVDLKTESSLLIINTSLSNSSRKAAIEIVRCILKICNLHFGPLYLLTSWFIHYWPLKFNGECRLRKTEICSSAPGRSSSAAVKGAPSNLAGTVDFTPQ